MKRSIICLAFALLMVCFSACDLQLPNDVLIKGNPEVKVALTIELDDIFDGVINSIRSGFNNNNDIDLITCNQTRVETLMLYTKLFDLEFDLSDSIDPEDFDLNPAFIEFLNELGVAGSPNYTPLNNKILGEDTIDIPLADFDDMLSGFSFNEAKILLYISGTGGLADLLTLELNNEDPVSIKNNKSFSDSNNAKLTTEPNSTRVYSGTQFPAGSVSKINLNSLSAGDINAHYKIYVKAGTSISLAELNENATIKVEAVIWLPLVLSSDPNSAPFELISSIMEGDDLFGRTSGSSDLNLTEFISSLNISLIFNSSPFQNATLYAESQSSGGDLISIPVPLNGNSITLNINEQILEEINDPKNIPFDPAIFLKFNSNGKLEIPRDFDLKITNLAFKAGLNYKISLSEGLQ